MANILRLHGTTEFHVDDIKEEKLDLELKGVQLGNVLLISIPYLHNNLLIFVLAYSIPDPKALIDARELCAAAAIGDMKEIKRLIKKKADPSAVSHCNRLPVQFLMYFNLSGGL